MEEIESEEYYAHSHFRNPSLKVRLKTKKQKNRNVNGTEFFNRVSN